MIDTAQRSQIRQLLSGPQWRTVEYVASEFVQRLKDQSRVKETEWQTLKAALLVEGQVQGISSFIQELYNLAKND